MGDRRQEWFDTMIRGLAAQQWQRSLGPDGYSCAYRAPNGCKCAIGQIIPDDAAVIQTGAGIMYLRTPEDRESLGLGPLTEDELLFLEDAQRAHDSAFDVESIKLRFQDVQRYYQLTWPTNVPE